MKNPETLEKLCEITERNLEKAVRELDNDPGKMSMQDAEYLDKLTHTLKSIKTTMAMEGYGSSERRGRSPYTGRYVSRDGGSYDGSYDNGRSMYAYDGGSYDDGNSRSYRGSYEGRSMNGNEMKEKLRRMADETYDERVKRALHTAMQQI